MPGKPIVDADLPKLLASDAPPSVLVFSAEWSAACGTLDQLLSKLQQLEPSVVAQRLDIDQSPETPGHFGVTIVPTILVIKGGQEKHRLVGQTSAEAVADAWRTHR